MEITPFTPSLSYQAPAAKISVESAPTDCVTLGVTSPHTPAVQPYRVTAAPQLSVPTDTGATTQSRSASGFALGVLVTLAVVGVAGYVISQQDGAVQPPTTGTVSHPSVPSDVAADAISDLRYLDRVGSRDGGGLFVNHLGVWRTQVSPEKGFQKLADGDTIEYKENKGAVPHEIRSFRELDDLRGEVEKQEIKKQIDQGVKEIGKGLRQIGDELKKIGDDFKKGFDEGSR